MSSSNAFHDSDDGDDDVCPLCCEHMDLSDKNFIPCPCGYRVCMWCWHRIKENYTGLCPACRSAYADDPHAFAAVDKEEVIKNENNKKKRAKQKDTDSAGAAAAAAAAREHQHALHLRHHHQHQQHMQHLHREQVQQQGGGRGGGGTGGATSVANRRELANMRVVQRNLVYATGLPAGLDSEEVLRRPENFGQYGKIYKIAISVSQTSDSRPGNFSAHITFAHKEDALACILATDGYWLEGRQLRSNFGTTKYCATYLRNAPCSNPDCLYLHELGDEEDRFTKEEIQQRSLLAPPIPPGAVTVTGGGGPSGTGMRCTSPYLPPPVYQSAENGSSSREGGSGRVMRSLSQGQQAAAAGGGATAAQRAAARGAKPAGQATATASASKTSSSVGVAWGGAGAANGPSAHSLGERSAVAVVMSRGKGPLGVASPTASPHLQAHNPTRLQEEWPSLADTAAPAPAPTPTPAAPTTNRTSRNRRKKEKQQLQQLQQQQQQQQKTQGEGGDSASSAAPPVSPPQDASPLPSATACAPSAPVQSPSATPAPTPLSQPPGLGPVAGAAPLPPASAGAATASVAVAAAAAVPPGSGPGDTGAAARAPLPVGQDVLTRTTSAGSTDTSSSMFSNPFFSNGGRGAGGSVEFPPASGGSSASAPAPPGFSELPPASVAATSVPASASSSSPSTSTVASASSPQPTTQPATQPTRSLFEEQFGGGEGVFNGGMFSSAAIGGGLFVGGAETGVTSSAPGTARAGGSPPPGLAASSGETAAAAAADMSQGASPLPGGASPSRRETAQESTAQRSEPIDASISELLNRPAKGLDKNTDNGGNDLSFASLGGAEPESTTSYGVGETTSTSTHVSASPFGAASGGGHFGSAFGSALFPVSTRQQGGSTQGAGRLGATEGPGADLSVDPFANSSGALARMLGVTLPPVDSHSSLASKMRCGLGGDPVHRTMEQDTSPQRSYLPLRGGNAYADFPRESGRGRPGAHVGQGKGGATGVDRDGGHRHDYGGNHQGGGLHQENHQASRFSFAQDENPGMAFSPARGSPPMGPDARGSPGAMGSPGRPGQHHHLHHHHQSHAHRPFGAAGQPVTPPRLGEYGSGGGEGQYAPPPPPQQQHHHSHPHHGQQHHFQQQQQRQQQQQQQHQQQQQQPSQQQQPQYSIQNGMAFLQKVLPGVSLSYGAAGNSTNRQPPPASGGGGGGGAQGHGQPQGQGASGAPAGAGVGWGDTTTQRVDPAQAFGSSLWTMAPAPAPRQPQGSRGGGFGAW